MKHSKQDIKCDVHNFVGWLHLENRGLLGKGKFGKVYEVGIGRLTLALKVIDLSKFGTRAGDVVGSEVNYLANVYNAGCLSNAVALAHYWRTFALGLLNQPCVSTWYEERHDCITY